MELLDKINDLGNKLINNFDLKNMQENFLNSNIGKTVNTAIDAGLKAILPDFIEDEVIEVKDALVTGGIKGAISTSIQNAVEVGKKLLGIEDSEFSSIEQAEDAIEKGEFLDKISSGIDNVLEKITNTKLISENISNAIKNGKDAILNNINKNVENEFTDEMKALEKIEKYIGNWEKCYSKKDVEGLNKEYNKIEKQMKKILPLENILKNVNKIENINELIKNNDNFDFSDVYLELAENL